MSYIKPQIALPSPLKVATQSGGLQRRVNSGDCGSPRGKLARNTRQKYSPFDLAGGGGGRLHEVWFDHFLNGYSFLMISPNLHDIWAMFFLILSRCETLDFFIVVRT
jgi:hypothetical protein